MINQGNFQQKIQLALEQLTHLPPCEAIYYLTLLLHSIKKINNTQTRAFLSEIVHFTRSLSQTLTTVDRQAFDKLCVHFKNLQSLAKTNTFLAQTKVVILHLGAAMLAIICGLLGALIGGMAGFARGLWRSQPVTGFLVGLSAGLWIGGSLGFRTPKKLLKDELVRQVTFGLNGLNQCLDNIDNEKKALTLFKPIKSYDNYHREVKAEIQSQLSEEEFEQFINAEISYEICTIQASFIGNSMLHGYLGHHAYIKIPINDTLHLIEYAISPVDLTKKPDQIEIRTTSGAKLLEMLAFHRKLQETEYCTLLSALKNMKPGDKDCLSYVNKILLGTGQKATQVQRFYEMSSVGKMLGQVVEELSPFRQDFLRA